MDTVTLVSEQWDLNEGDVSFGYVWNCTDRTGWIVFDEQGHEDERVTSDLGMEVLEALHRNDGEKVARLLPQLQLSHPEICLERVQFTVGDSEKQSGSFAATEKHQRLLQHNRIAELKQLLFNEYKDHQAYLAMEERQKTLPPTSYLLEESWRYGNEEIGFIYTYHLDNESITYENPDVAGTKTIEGRRAEAIMKATWDGDAKRVYTLFHEFDPLLNEETEPTLTVFEVEFVYKDRKWNYLVDELKELGLKYEPGNRELMERLHAEMLKQ